MTRPITVAWFSQFPVEWLSDAPDEVKCLPREHPSTWQSVLLAELEKNPAMKLHVIVLRKQFARNLTFERNGVTFHLLKTVGGLRAPSLFWLDTWLIARKLKTIKPDVIHAWGTERGGALVASRLHYPRLVTMQGLMSWYEEIVPVNRLDRLAAYLERYSLPKAQLVTTESTFAVNWLREKYPGLQIRQVEHAPAWLFHQLQRRPQTQPLRFLFVGTFDFRKGADLLVRALDQLRRELLFEMIVVGKPHEEFLQKLRRETSAEVWERIQFKRDLTPPQVAAEMARATLMIFPTRADTSPNSVKEAVVAGLPVVASAIGGILDYVFPGKNGELFPAGDLEELTSAIRRACGHRLFGHGEVEASTLERVRDYLSPARMGKGFAELYRQLAAKEV